MILENFSQTRSQRIAAITLGAGTFLGLIAGGILWMGSNGNEPIRLPKARVKEIQPLTFSLGVEEKVPSFSLPNVEGELAFSSSLLRPNGAKEPPLFIQLKRNGLVRKITLSTRVDLKYDEKGALVFSDESSSFWLALNSLGNKVETRVFLRLPQGEEIEAQRIVIEPQETPIQRAEDFTQGTPFRILGEARWWGPDLFREKYGESSSAQRIEIGSLPELCELSGKEWLVWREGKWKKTSHVGDEELIARLEGIEGKNLILEGWEGDTHVRISLAAFQSPSFKARGEELFHSIRIRSEKQISCMLEKQCLILRLGDWVFRGDGRWKILRKKEDREALKKGDLVGEIFVLDGIEIRQGQKVILGSLFNAARSQMVSIELPAFSPRKVKEEISNRKGR